MKYGREGYQEASWKLLQSYTGEAMVAPAVGVEVLNNDHLLNIESIGFVHALEVECE